MNLEPKDILAPALSLVGTLLVAVIGYRQWRKSQQTNFLLGREAAYKTAWGKMEQLHLYVRSESYTAERFNELLRNVNIHLTEAGLYLERGEKKRINDYLETLRDLGQLLKDDDTANEDRAGIKATLHDTQMLSAVQLEEMENVASAYRLVEQRREDLIKRFRKYLGA